jgi:hypothetical protein
MSVPKTKIKKNLPKRTTTTGLIKEKQTIPKFNPYYSCFVIYRDGKMKKVPGLTKILKSTFWPNYKYSRSHFSISTGAKNSNDGIKRGKTVHSQIDRWFKTEEPDRILMYNNLEPYTKKLIAAFKMWEMKPYLSEYVVYDEKSNLCTAVDAIVEMKDGTLAIIELKCGFDGYLKKSNGNMVVPKGLEIPNHPLNQAYFQLAFECLMLQNFSNIKFSHAFVVQIQSEGVTKHRLPPYFEKNALILYNHMNDLKAAEKLLKRKRK